MTHEDECGRAGAGLQRGLSEAQGVGRPQLVAKE